MKGRIFKPNTFHHVYTKAKDGNIIFYSQEDCLYYLSLYYVLSKQYYIHCNAFCIMPNHTHSSEKCDDEINFRNFHSVLTREFAKGYNRQHNRKSQLFFHCFGFAPKPVGKSIRSCIAYIANNPVVGKISKNVTDYRWNLMAYYNNTHPYSEKIVRKHASNRLRRSLALLEYYHCKGNALTYTIQKILFDGLTTQERTQLTDFAISFYNTVDYKKIINLYSGSYSDILNNINCNTAGKEYDIPEDWEDYSIYSKMLRAAAKDGFDFTTVNFEAFDSDRINDLWYKMSITGANRRQICRFLHQDQSEDWVEAVFVSRPAR